MPKLKVTQINDYNTYTFDGKPVNERSKGWATLTNGVKFPYCPMKQELHSNILGFNGKKIQKFNYKLVGYIDFHGQNIFVDLSQLDLMSIEQTAILK